MAYSVQHHYQWDGKKRSGTVLLCIKNTLAEAEAYVKEHYAHRAAKDKDQVVIHDETGRAVKVWEVEYMPQFEAKKGKVWHFPSSSSSATYTAQINTTGVLSCNCRAWAMGWKKMHHPLAALPYRHCSHLDSVIQRQNLKVEVKGQYLFEVDPRVVAAKQKYAPKGFAKATGPQEKFALLVADYENAIATMAAMEPDQMYQMGPTVELAKFKVESYLLLLEEHGIDGTAQFKAAEAKLQAVLH